MALSERPNNPDETDREIGRILGGFLGGLIGGGLGKPNTPNFNSGGTLVAQSSVPLNQVVSGQASGILFAAAMPKPSKKREESAKNKQGEGKSPQKGHKPDNIHPNTGNPLLETLPDTDISKLDQQIMTAKPSVKFTPRSPATLDNPGTHDPKSLKYQPGKSVMPSVTEQVKLFQGSVEGPLAQSRGAVDANGNVHQFHLTNPDSNTFHWSGQQGGKTKTGTDVKLDDKTISYFERLWSLVHNGQLDQ
jgi:hypothetical protein